MFVIHDTARLVEDLPTALPSFIAEIGVFEIKGPKELVESAQLEKLATIESTGAAAAIEARERFGNRGVDAMTYAQASVLPPAVRQPGFLAQLRRIADEAPARNV